jgi:hypothetical protein
MQRREISRVLESRGFTPHEHDSANGIPWDRRVPHVSIHAVQVHFKSGSVWSAKMVNLDLCRGLTLREAVSETMPRNDATLKYLTLYIGRQADIYPIGHRRWLTIRVPRNLLKRLFRGRRHRRPAEQYVQPSLH